MLTQLIKCSGGKDKHAQPVLPRLLVFTLGFFYVVNHPRLRHCFFASRFNLGHLPICHTRIMKSILFFFSSLFRLIVVSFWNLPFFFFFFYLDINFDDVRGEKIKINNMFLICLGDETKYYTLYRGMFSHGKHLK